MIEVLHKLTCDNCRVIYMSDNDDSLDALYSAGWLMDEWGHYCSAECQNEASVKRLPGQKLLTAWKIVEELMKPGTNSIQLNCDGGAMWECRLELWEGAEFILTSEGDTIEEAIFALKEKMEKSRKKI